jgi:ATP-dependent RNA helicase DDX56/DBP9
MAGFQHKDAYLELAKTEDKYLVLYTMLQLSMVQGKVLLYVNSSDSAYKVHLFLREFSIHSLVLNYELPKSTRHLTVSNFINKEVNILIVSDPDEETSQNKGCKRHKVYKTPVSVLFNFEFPTSINVYRRRLQDVTADISSNITVLSFVLPEELPLLEKLQRRFAKKEEAKLEDLQLKMTEFERFRYRCSDVFRTVGDSKVKKTKLNEVKKALLASKTLKEHFEENPNDRKLLQKAKYKPKVKAHLANVPVYLLPESIKDQEDPTFRYKAADFEARLARRQKRPARDIAEEYVEEEPTQINWQDLPPISNRKWWKIRHHKSLQKKSMLKRRKL